MCLNSKIFILGLMKCSWENIFKVYIGTVENSSRFKQCYRKHIVS